MKMDFKEKTIERYPEEVHQGICRCVNWTSITRASVGIQYASGFADISGGKSITLENWIKTLMDGVLVGIM